MSCCETNTKETNETALPRVLLLGNPNVGKSVIFRLLTGRYVIVSNYPGTTVEVAKGMGTIGGRKMLVIDTPGVNSLSPHSEDERVTSDVLLEPGEKTVVQVADAKNLRRALMTTIQLGELETPMVMALNMWDEAQDRGLKIDTSALRQALGVPVVPMVATERRGLHHLESSLKEAASTGLRANYGTVIEGAVTEVSALLPEATTGRRGIALMLLGGNSSLEEAVAPRAKPGFREALRAIRNETAAAFADALPLVMQRRRTAAADELVQKTVVALRAHERTRGPARAVFFLAVMPAFFYLIGWQLASFLLFALRDGAPRFSALGPFGSAVAAHAVGFAVMLLYSVSAWRREYAQGGSAAAALARLSTHPLGGFPILIYILWVTYQLVGRLGAGTLVDFMQRRVFGVADASGALGGYVNGPLSRAFERYAAKGSLMYDLFFSAHAGLISAAVTYSLAIVLPIVTLFFLAFALMEDSGYLPRLSLLLDRIFKRMGLSGKAVLPMVLGLGCGTMATMGTRILETRRQRLIAILLLTLAVPCSAQLGVITATLAGISATGVLIYVAVIVLVMFATGWAAAQILPGETADLLIEVPPFRWPSLLNVVVKTAHRVKWFMREAVPLFLLGTLFLFVAEQTGLLKAIEWAARPVVTGLLGLPAPTALGFIMAFLRRDYGAIIIFTQFQKGEIQADQALVALVVITLFVPCVAHFFICIKELGWRKAMAMDALVFTLAFLIGGLLRAFLALTGIHVAPGL